MLTASVVRTLLIIDIAAMTLLALLYLRQRRMAWTEYWGWGLIAVILPVIGPFLVIARRPGQFDPSFSFWQDVVRLLGYLRRVLPEAPPRPTRLARARKRRSNRSTK